MKINRVFFALMAALLLPVTAMAQLIPSPAPGTANVVASVFFDNGYGNDTPVTLEVACTAASIAPSSATVVPVLGVYEQAFVVFNIATGVDNKCTLTQTPVAGYTASYECGTRGFSSLSGECVDGPTISATSCVFPDIQAGDPGDVGGCLVVNEVDAVDFVVTKVWDVTNAGAAGDDYNLESTIKVRCDTYFDGAKDNDGWVQQFYLDGPGSITIHAYPDFDGSHCWAKEAYEDSAVDVDQGCETHLPIEVGVGNSCTITNTLFFEGIPTLNQYGMAIMALLMLGVGFVGFRRFV